MAVVLSMAGMGGVELGGTAPVAFVHGSGPVLSDVVLEWDFDNDGDFDRAAEDITDVFVSGETMTGRDWPSQLTGKAGPGKLKANLRNDDNRFSIFNESSPLNQPPLSLDTGRKLRIRTAEAPDPDPVLLARDRFRRPDGPLGAAEVGGVWEWPGSPFNAFEIIDETATATVMDPSEGLHINTLDVGVDEYFVQARLGRASIGQTTCGPIYRYADENNFSMLVIDEDGGGIDGFSLVSIVDIVAGVPDVTPLFQLPSIAGWTLGVLIADGEGRPYVDGVDMTAVGFVDPFTPLNDGATRVGIWGDWVAHVPPEIERFDCWATVPAPTDGILWTGDVSDIKPHSAPGPNNTAALTGAGWLSKLATHRVLLPGFIRSQATGTSVGRILADSGLLFPPGPIDLGLTTGPVGFDELDAIEAARRFEETELGFLHEMQEGPIAFEGREARAGRTSQAVFSDDPAAQFSYEDFKLLDWRREIINQVRAGVAPSAPTLVASGSLVGPTTGPQITQSPGGTSPQAGDLLIASIVVGGIATIEWRVPPGWEQLTAGKGANTDGSSDDDNFRIYARHCDGTESGLLQVATASATVETASQSWLIRDWFGDIEAGVSLADEALGSTPAPITPPWDPAPSGLLAMRVGRLGNSFVAFWTEQGFDGWFRALQTLNQDTSGVHLAIQTVWKVTAAEPVIAPAQFDGNFAGFGIVQSRGLAIRGFNGDPPEPSGPQIVQVDDLDSQQRHNSIRSHINASNLFRLPSSAEAYGEAVLDRHAEARPVVEISFTANKSAAYRMQAVRRRVGDRITLVANHSTGQGIEGEFFIENIKHRFSKAGTLWRVTWQLSPA